MIVREGGAYRRDKIPVQELEPKVQGGLMHERGHNCGILRYMCYVVVRRGKALMYMYMIVTVVAIVDLLLDC